MNAMCRIEGPIMANRQARPCPDDFEIVFVEQGRIECEPWYRARRTTINRWLEECGKERLIRKRAEYVKYQREQARRAKRPRHGRAPVVKDRRRINPRIARRAAEYLRHVRNGGWVVTNAGDGDWIVGTRRRSPAELVDMAVGRGFDIKQANLQLRSEGMDN